MGPAVGGAHRLVPLDADELLRRALDGVGASSASEADLGDPAWRERYGALVAALDTTAAVHVVGRLMLREELLRCLRTRLFVGRHHAAHAGAGRERIAAPLIVAGPARSGTTILFELLAQDPALRAPLAWEGLHPLPLPEDPADDLRPLVAECEQDFWADVQPEFDAVHELRATLPVECVTLMAPAFAMGHWSMVANLPGWVGEPAPAYRFHTQVLQVLQHRRPTAATWVLKTPLHLLCLPLVLATYPDAWIVQTHRDPVRTMASSVSTLAINHWLRSDTVDVPGVVAGLDVAFVTALLETTRARAAGELPDERFVDVGYGDLLADPVRTVASIYERTGRAWTDAHARRVRAYLAGRPKDRHGRHGYSAAEWGIDADDLRARLRPYLERHRVPLEA